MKSQSTFETYRSIRKNAATVLINSGIPVRAALKMLKSNAPCLFMGKSECEEYDRMSALYPIV